MNKDFERISIWSYQWKMCFNPDSSHLTLYINKTGCLYKNIQLSIYITEKVSNTILKKKLQKHKEIGFSKKLINILSRNALSIIYKTFVRTHLNYWNIMYYQHSNVNQRVFLGYYWGRKTNFKEKKHFKELRPESLKSRRTSTHFYHVIKLYLLSFLLIFST